MKYLTLTSLAVLLSFGGMVDYGHAAGGGAHEAKEVDYSFEGPLGHFDKAQLQRGYQVYREVCSACHSMELMYFRNLGEAGGPGLSEEQVKAIAAEYTVMDGPDSEGEMFERPARPSDHFVSPFPNPQAAMSANGGAYPTDLSLITKARVGYHGTFKQLVEGVGGPEYVYSVLTGYEDAPEGKEGPDGKYYNPYFAAGPWISMAAPLYDEAVEYADGTEASVDQMAKDVSAFLAWSAEPKMVERKETGLRVMIFLIIFAGLLYASYKRLWRNIDH
jgi:cytochrome c1